MTKKPAVNAGNVYKSDTEEFRRNAVRMIETEGLKTSEVGRRLGVNAALRPYIEEALLAVTGMKGRIDGNRFNVDLPSEIREPGHQFCRIIREAGLVPWPNLPGQSPNGIGERFPNPS